MSELQLHTQNLPHTLSEIRLSHNYCANVNSDRQTKPNLQQHEHNDHLAR